MTVYLLPVSLTYHDSPTCSTLARSNRDALRELPDEHATDPRLDPCDRCTS